MYVLIVHMCLLCSFDIRIIIDIIGIAVIIIIIIMIMIMIMIINITIIIVDVYYPTPFHTKQTGETAAEAPPALGAGGGYRTRYNYVVVLQNDLLLQSL